MNEKRFLFSKNGVLYKYRTWSNQNHKNTLLNGEFYLASPRDFNDPYDCQITIDFDELDTPQKKQEFVNHEMVHHFDRLSKKGVNIESAIREADNRILDTKKFREEWSALANHYYQTNYGILSFSKTWKSILMWSHYANNHRGFCIGIKEEALLDIVCAGQFSRGGLVNYPSTYPKISPFLNWFDKIWQQTMTKAKCWDYEEEYRLVKYLS